MFLDTGINSPDTVLCTVYQNLLEAAMKYYRYFKSMTKSKRPQIGLMTGKICGITCWGR